MTDAMQEDETPKPKPEAETEPVEETAPAEPVEEVDGSVGDVIEETIAEAVEAIGEAAEVAVDELAVLREENARLKADLADEQSRSRELAEEVLDTMTRIDSAEKSVDSMEEKLNDAKELVKQRKELVKERQESFEYAVAHFRAVVKEAREPFPLLGRKSLLSERAKDFLDHTGTAVADPPADLAGLVVDENRIQEIAPATAKFLPSPDDDSWKRVPISIYSLPLKLVEAMESAEIWTVGHLAAWTNGGKLLTDIPKVGEAKAKVIQDADLLFWERWSKGEITPPEAPKPVKPPGIPDSEPFTNLDAARAEYFDKEVKPLAESFEPPASEFDPDSDSQSQTDDGDPGEDPSDADDDPLSL